MYDRGEVLHAGSVVPASPGVYGWWFQRPPSHLMDVSYCRSRDGMTLPYVGISPKRPSASGAVSRQNLRRRLRTHYRGRASTSTPRLSLGALLADELGIQLALHGTKRHFGVGEPVLSEWMGDNTRVSWLAVDEPWLVEEALIRQLDVPLNLEGNSHNPFYRDLKLARARAAASATS
ncbi:GIY-YIG nuclease family protein [Gordonia hongkongensis]|uniref:GIY-YIG nuclease family protein n=1 Tax=Gordonia hongkongensis TaxID=1701090 RepID=UPI00300DE6F2